MIGTITIFFQEEGNGFILGMDEKTYFFDIKDFISAKSDEVANGAMVSFESSITSKGMQAIKIVMVQESEFEVVSGQDFMLKSRKNTGVGNIEMLLMEWLPIPNTPPIWRNKK